MQVAEVNRPLFAVREMKSAQNMVLFGVDEEHAVINKKTSKIVYNGGKDVVVNKVSNAKTEIVDTGKDYILNFLIKKPDWYEGAVNTVSKFQQCGHGVWKKEEKNVKTSNRFRALDEDEMFATFRRPLCQTGTV
jgi:hypothetical protein